MTTIYSYAKFSTPHTIIQMALPDNQGADDSLRCTELCTLDGTTYVAVPDGLTLPTQPSEINPQPVALGDDLVARIKAASPHVQLIYERTEQQIRARYSMSDEAKFARIGVGVALGVYTFEPGEQAELLAFGDYVEACRQWSRDEKAKLGL
jgi:hypothetical protein